RRRGFRTVSPMPGHGRTAAQGDDGRDRREAAHGGVGGTSQGRKTNRTEDQADRERIRRRAAIRGCSRAYGDALRYRRSQICDCANVCINDPDFVDSFLDRFSRRRVFGLFVLVPTRLKALLSPLLSAAADE